MSWLLMRSFQWPENDNTFVPTPPGWGWRNYGVKPALVVLPFITKPNRLSTNIFITFVQWEKATNATISRKQEDKGAHYRMRFKQKITEADLEKGYVVVKMDPYRVCKIYKIGGGAREHLIKKALRGCDKGHTELDLIAELRSCLDRWEDMYNEDKH